MTELSEALQRFVAEPHVATLATLRKDGSAHLTAVWYQYTQSEIRVSVTTGRLKYKHALRDARVSLAIVGSEAPLQQVIFEGRAEFTQEGGPELFRTLAIRYMGEADGNRYADYDSQPGREPRLILHYRPERIMAWDFSVEDDYHRPWGEGAPSF